jgi:hypothetical protein
MKYKSFLILMAGIIPARVGVTVTEMVKKELCTQIKDGYN